MVGKIIDGSCADNKLGLILGSKVSFMDGSNVGPDVSTIVVGGGVGFGIGSAVGRWEGNTVGEKDGFWEGVDVRTTDGITVGLRVGKIRLFVRFPWVSVS